MIVMQDLYQESVGDLLHKLYEYLEFIKLQICLSVLKISVILL